MEQPNSEKCIGLVKWFHDQTKNANYGFIQHVILGDLFFHEKSIEQGQDINSFKENEIVVFISQPSRNHADKLEAVQVRNLKTEKDLKFLFGHFLLMIREKEKYSDYNIIQKGVHARITKLLDNSIANDPKEELFSQYKSFLITQDNSKLQLNAIIIKGLLNICRNFFSDKYNEVFDLIEKKINVETAHNLWLEKYTEKCQVNYIAKFFLNTDIATKIKIFNRCNADDKSNIFFNIIYAFERIDTDLKLETIKEILNLSKEFSKDQHEKILNAVIKICPEYIKLDLWLADYYEELDFNSYKLFTITLQPQDQKKFVKKVLKYIHEEKSDISVEELTSINIIDYETSKLLEGMDKSHLDYSTSIILNVISELKSQTKFESRKETSEAQIKIYDLILKQIKEPEDILQITGYFDECGGRCSVSVQEEKNEEEKIIDTRVTYNRNENNKPKLHPICDGRKAINKATDEPILSDDSKLEYWWCANQKCFKPSRELHNSDDWEKYTLLDFLKILKVQYREIDLDIYLNIINKANRFLKHLKCRECNHILYPKGKSQYAFYGISNFKCVNEKCSKKDQEIYLSHCLNGFCEMEIDSRDCVKCKPPGLDPDTCGWYVCNYCHSCCNSQQLQKRKWVYDNILHKEYKCHLIGHKDLGIVSCNNCGDSMESKGMDIKEYQRVLNWFIINRDKSNRIHKSAKNKFDKWWFVIKRGSESYENFREKLNKYYQLGFQIPDFDKDKDLQLISEPIDFNKHSSDILICKSCGNTLDLSSDLERARAIKSFHNIKFIKEPAEH